MQPTYVGGESPFDFRHAGLHPSTCVKLGQNCIILGPKSANLPQYKSHGITDIAHMLRGKPAYTGSYLIAILYPFLLKMSAICVKANTNKKYRELPWHY